MFSIDQMAHLRLLTNYIQLILSSIFPLAFFKKINYLIVTAIDNLSVFKLRFGNFSFVLLSPNFQVAVKVAFSLYIYEQEENFPVVVFLESSGIFQIAFLGACKNYSPLTMMNVCSLEYSPQLPFKLHLPSVHRLLKSGEVEICETILALNFLVSVKRSTVGGW